MFIWYSCKFVWNGCTPEDLAQIMITNLKQVMAWGSPWHPLWCRPVRSRRKVRKDQQVQPASQTYLVNNMPCKYKSVGISLPHSCLSLPVQITVERNKPSPMTHQKWLVQNPPNLEASPMGRASSAFRIWFRTLWTCVRDDPSAVAPEIWVALTWKAHEGTMYTFKIIQRKHGFRVKQSTYVNIKHMLHVWYTHRVHTMLTFKTPPRAHSTSATMLLMSPDHESC